MIKETWQFNSMYDYEREPRSEDNALKYIIETTGEFWIWMIYCPYFVSKLNFLNLIIILGLSQGMFLFPGST